MEYFIRQVLQSLKYPKVHLSKTYLPQLMLNLDIVIITDFEEGHVLPLFKMANSFKNNGLKVCFAGLVDTEEIVRANGFEYHIIFEKHFPKGYVRKIKQRPSEARAYSTNYMESVFEELDNVMSKLNPKLVFTSCFFSLIALIIHYKYSAKQVIFHTLFPYLVQEANMSLSERSINFCIERFMGLSGNLSMMFMDFFDNLNLSFGNLAETVLPLKSIKQIMLCPKALDIDLTNLHENDIYLGPCINPMKNFNEGEFTFPNNKKNKKLIFASMGSQTKEYPENALIFFNAILKSMNSNCLQNFHLILSVGSELTNWNLDEIPENASVYSWVPQLKVLQKSSLAIIHGGLGSVKECIYFGNPMIVIPMGRDQMDNAQRIEYHGLGITMDVDQINSDVLSKKIQLISEDRLIKKNILKMKTLFQEADKRELEVELVKTLIE